jgi:hypothetical protein
MIVVTPSNVGSFVVLASGLLGDVNEPEDLPQKNSASQELRFVADFFWHRKKSSPGF